MQIAAEVSNMLVNVGIPSMIGLQVWLVKKVSGFDVKFSRLDTWAFGPTGNNGANSRISKAEDEIEALKDREREPR